MNSKWARWVVLGFIALMTGLRLWGHFSEPARIDACAAQGGTWSFEQDDCVQN